MKNLATFLYAFGILLGLSLTTSSLSAQCNNTAYTCEDATRISSLPYTMSMGEFNSPLLGLPVPGCQGGATFHNTHWFEVIPTTPFLLVDIIPSNCLPGDGGQLGIQASMFSSCDLENSVVGTIQCDCTLGSVTVGGVVTPGVPYYILIDGCSGSFCDIDMTLQFGDIQPASTVTLGVPDIPIPDRPLPFCTGQEVEFYLPPVTNADDYEWSFPAGVTVIEEDCNVATVVWGENEGNVSVTAINTTTGESNAGPPLFVTLDSPTYFTDFYYCANEEDGVIIDGNLYPPGEYEIVIPGSFCDSIYIVNVQANFIEVANVMTTEVSCGATQNEGEATIFMVNNGAEPYTFEWEGFPGNSPSMQSLPVGITSVTVTDQNGCSEIVDVEIEYADNLEVMVNIVSEPTCEDLSGGAINFSITNGTSPFEFLWFDGSEAANRTGLTAGPVSVTITDANDCVFEWSDVLEIDGVAGGMLTGGDFTFFLDNNEPDTIGSNALELTTNTSVSNQWVITNTDGEIIALPSVIETVDFDTIGLDTALIWNLTYDGNLNGLDIGASASDLEGCYGFSNSVQVIRIPPMIIGPDIRIDISTNNAAYDIYELIEFKITVTNEGDETMNNIEASASIPDGLVYAGEEVSQGNYNFFVGHWEVGSLAAGESAVLIQKLFTLVDGIDIVNYVQIIAHDETDIDSTPNNNPGLTPTEDDESAVTLSETGGTGPQVIDLELFVEVDNPTFDQYEVVTYFITLENNGEETAHDIDVTVPMPNGLVFTGATGTNDSYYIPYFETWYIDSIPAGATEMLTLELFTLVENTSITSFIEVAAANEGDVDSSPGNGNGITPLEDDEAVVTIMVTEPLSASNLQPIASRLFPNPAQDEIHLQIEIEEDLELKTEIYNIQGQLMQVETNKVYKGQNNIDLNIHNLEKGSYFIKSSNGKQVMFIERFVKF